MSDQEKDSDVSELEQEKQKLLSKNEELLTELKDLKQFRNSINEMGGVEKIQSVFAAQEEAQRKEVEESNDVEAIKAQYQTQMKDLQQELDAMKTGIVESKLESQLKSAVSKAGGEFDLLQHALKSRVKAEMVGTNDIKYSVLDDTGSPLIVEGRDARISDLVEQFKEHDTFGKAFGLQKHFTGSGAKQSSDVKVTNNPFVKGEGYDLKAQTELFKRDPIRAKRLMAEAGVMIPRSMQ